MKIIVVGGTGTIGQAVVDELSQRHEVIVASAKRGKITVDIADPVSIESMFEAVGEFDALVSTVGHAHYAPFAEMTSELYQIGLANKLMGQVNLVLQGRHHINAGGSFTLTSGILNDDPILQATSSAMANGGLEGFVKAAAIDMPKSLRINIVSPTVLAESMEKLASFFRGFDPVPAAKVALAYSKSVEGAQTGQIIRVGY